jgi:hypothetical protein
MGRTWEKTTMANRWFEASKDGVREMVGGRPKSFVIRELVQNAWDENGVTVVDVKLNLLGRSRYELSVEDDSLDGFRDITHAYTMYSESKKREDPNSRGQFVLGEKQVLSLCTEAKIITTSKGVVFNADGTRSWTKQRRTRGSLFWGLIKISDEEFKEVCQTVKTFIVPKGIKTIFNGEQLPERKVFKVISATLETQFLKNRVMRSSRRNTTVDILKPQIGRASCRERV